jgi:hypothetical protein
MVKEKGPKLVFLMETRICNKDTDFLRIKLKFDYIFVVDSVGRSCGLILLWKNDINIEIQNYNRRHINVIVSMGRDGVKWKFSRIYGNPETAKGRKPGFDAAFIDLTAHTLALHGRFQRDT